MKVVINNCYGGFGLSHKGIMRYAELAGFKLYPWSDKRYMKSSIGQESEYVNLSDEEAQKEMFCSYSKSPIVDGQHPSKEDYFPTRDFDRSDPVLLAVVEELGEEADGGCAELKVVEIPDGTDFVVEEYDGMEWVAERHQTWS